MRFCLIDTGPIVALFDKSDAYHDQALEFISDFKGTLITSLATITETLYLLDFNQNAQLAFLKWIEAGAVQIESIDHEDFGSLISNFEKYADRPIDFADGCLLVLAERLGIIDIATIDNDFENYRLSKNRTFRIHVKS
ncbi:MAG: PIN domain-containing protein [Balneolaceae bacterium]|nr:PIN domain-containing protein [Balneolaceae bacterium]